MRRLHCHVQITLLLVAAAGVGLGGCAADGASSTGTVSLNLVGQAPSGAIYRLRDAIVTVTGPDSTQVFNTEDDPDRTSLSASVASGDYAASISPGFRVERIAGMSATTVDAELITPNPAAFTVFPEQRTTVPLRFRVATEDVDMAQGYDIVLEIEEESARWLAVTNYLAPSGRPSIAVFDAAANGDATPLQTIARPPITEPSQAVSVAVVGNELFVLDQVGQAINVFSRNPSGDLAPIRHIRGPSTKIAIPHGIAVSQGEIYVADDVGLAVFPLRASGDVAPTRTISDVSNVRDFQQLAIDQGELYVSDYFGEVIRVYPVHASDPASPTRSIAIAGKPTGVVVRNGELFVADTRNGTILVFDKTASGTPAPLRTITPPGPPAAFNQLAVTKREIYAADFWSNRIEVFPVDADGAVAPTRTISGASTELDGPTGLYVF